jgi:hypothetical protein
MKGKIKGILTDCFTNKKRETEIEYKIVEDDGNKIFHLINGPTGYEGFSINDKYTSLDRICKNGWHACVGTKRVYDELFIPPEEMKKALESCLKTR